MSIPISSMTAMAKGSTGCACTPTESTKTRRACRRRSIAAAIGERIELKLQAKSTLPGSRAIHSASDVQHADEGEEPARGVEVDLDLVRQPLPQQLRALVVQAAPAHVESLDARRTRGADGGVIVLADQEVVADDAAEGLQRQLHPLEQHLRPRADLQAETI